MRKPITARGSRLLAILLCAWALAAGADEQLPEQEQKVAPTAFDNEPPEPKLSWGTGDGRSYLIPAGNVFLFDFLLNRFDHAFIGNEYDVTADSIRHNLHRSWVYDQDPFEINQFGHPYQGAMYHGFARAAGVDYWPSMAYTVGGSLLWEIAGETTPPSINDQFTTGLAGNFLGEPLFRLASLMLESSRGRPGFWREFGAAAISPATGFTRWAYGRRFDGVFRSHDPAVHTAVHIGANLNATVDTNLNLNPEEEEAAIPQDFRRGEATVDFLVAYGLPGKPGYRYTRPFDYFHLQLTAATSNVLESLSTRGLLYGTDYAIGDHYRGIWGLYGSYDYIAPQIFRVSTTAAGLGTTGQWWLSHRVALQGTALAAIGYGSGGVIDGRGERDYHNGVTPQGLVALRLLLSDRAALELTVRDYYISDIASDEHGGAENIARGEAAFTVRVKGLHGISLKYVVSYRDARYEDLDDTRQTVGAVSLAYTYLGHPWFGAVDWRPEAQSR